VWQDHIQDLETLIKENLDEINQHIFNTEIIVQVEKATELDNSEVLEKDNFSLEISEIDNKIKELKSTQNHISA
jgi:hypothetical protein